jgi:hypothetical protein
MRARYRVVHFVPDPFLGGRVPIAALVEYDGGKVAIARATHLPGADCLGGRDVFFTAQLILEDLAHATRFDRLPSSIGPHAFLDQPYEVPRNVKDPLAWINTCLFPHEIRSRHEREPRAPKRATWGYRFLQSYKVSQYVKKTFRPGEDAGGYLARATVLKPIAHYVEGRSDLLLMEPVVLRRPKWQEDVSLIATNFGAYKTAIRGESGQPRARLTAYVLAGGSKEDFDTIARELSPFADDVVDTENPMARAKFVAQIREVGQSNPNWSPDLFEN